MPVTIGTSIRSNLRIVLASLALVVLLVPALAIAQSEEKKSKKGAAAKGKFTAKGKVAPKSEVVIPKNLEYSKANKSKDRTNLTLISDKNLGKPLTTGQLDELLIAELVAAGVEKGERRVSDDQFIRRVYLDVIGQLPSPADIEEYVGDKSEDKKAKLVDKLLAMPQYGKNWARYWFDVVVYRQTAGQNRLRPFQHADEWLAKQFNDNVSWGKIVETILTPSGLSDDHPEGFFLGAHEGKAEEVTGEAARIFMGVQIACAQCHDHPTEVWKRDQFHELASFFGKTSVRVRRNVESKLGGPVVEISASRKDYRKPDLEDPTNPGSLVSPMFLTGQPVSADASDVQRRQAAATFITSKRNPYFAKSFVNRVWYELMGYGFNTPVDDLGSNAQVTLPKVFDALSKSFVAGNYDIKLLMKTVLNSKMYEREFREVDAAKSSDSLALFRTINPTRLAAEQIFESLDWVLGNIDDGRRGMGGGRRGPVGVKGNFRLVFGFDPSTDKDGVEGSIPQALLLMNNGPINNRIAADRAGTLLSKLLKTQTNDAEVIRMLYLRVLARKPTLEEAAKAQSFVHEVGKRTEAFEDLLWALVNSTEFLYKH